MWFWWLKVCWLRPSFCLDHNSTFLAWRFHSRSLLSLFWLSCIEDTICYPKNGYIGVFRLAIQSPRIPKPFPESRHSPSFRALYTESQKHLDLTGSGSCGRWLGGRGQSQVFSLYLETPMSFLLFGHDMVFWLGTTMYYTQRNYIGVFRCFCLQP